MAVDAMMHDDMLKRQYVNGVRGVSWRGGGIEWELVRYEMNGDAE